jgi:hypothetical protein
MRGLLGLAFLAVVLAAQAATAAPAPIEFAVTLRATLSEQRTFTTTRTVRPGCEETTTGESALRIGLRSTKASSVLVRRGSNGALVFVKGTLRDLVATVRNGPASAQTPSCSDPGMVAVDDCSTPLVRRPGVSTRLDAVGPGSLVIYGTRPALPSKAGCSPAVPRSVEPLDLSLVEGRIAQRKLFDPTAKIVAAVGDYVARSTVPLANGRVALVQRVHWQLTFSRVL